MLQKKLLIVEDEPDIASLQKDFFEMYDFSVDIVSDGFEAVKSIEKTKYDVILSDIKMPKADGLFFLDQFHQSHKLEKRPKFFIVTGVPDFDKEDAQSRGADGVFSKPINFGKILSAIHKCNL